MILGASIFNIIGYPTAPVNMNMKGVKKMFLMLNDLKYVPLFYKKIFFNCPSLEPIYGGTAPVVNEFCKLFKSQWIEDDMPVNTITTSLLNTISPAERPRSLSRGRVSEGRYVPNVPTMSNQYTGRRNSVTQDYRNGGNNRGSRYDNYQRNTNNGAMSRDSSRSISRNRRSAPFYNSNGEEARQVRPPVNNNGQRTPGTATNHPSLPQLVNRAMEPQEKRLEVRYPMYQDLMCYPHTCDGIDCDKKPCKKCGLPHNTHNCGYYLHLSTVPCERCPNLFHNINECQNASVTFPELSKN